MHQNTLTVDNSILLIIDIQEKFISVIHESEKMLKNTEKLIKAADILGIPVVCTEQYPKGLGYTVEELKTHLGSAKFFEKTAFSCCRDDEFNNYLKSLNRKQVIISGIETHVCVNQTVHDLLALDYQPHVIKEAVSSRCPDNVNLGIEKMKASGAIISGVEIALFELLETAKNPNFKEVQKLVI